MTKKHLLKRVFTILPGIALAFCAVSTTVALNSCGNSGANDSIVVVAGAASKEDLMKIVEGGWVNLNYGEALMRVHSPMFAAEAGRPVQEMHFDLTKMKGDTLFNRTGRVNYLPGERFDIVFGEENGSNVMMIYEGMAVNDPATLSYKINGDDTLLCVVRKGSNDSDWYTRVYRTAPIRAGISQNALEHYVNSSLFAGEWKATDGSMVTFSADGKVSGWSKWTWFNVEIDKYGTEIQPDVMSAYNDKMGATYVYTLDNDRLSIFEYDTNSEDGMWTRGDLVIELTRKHAGQ
jgi:hypothetical protein